MKVLTRALQWLFILCLLVMVITGSITWAVNSAWLYTASFEKYDVIRSLADNGLLLNRTDMQNIARGFIRYFNSGERYLDLTVESGGQTVALFNQEEILHFSDVKRLFRLDYGVLFGTFLYCLAFALFTAVWRKGSYRPLLARSLVAGSGVTLGIMAFIGIGAWLDFDWLFYQFHLISFSNQFWSAEGNMLLLFPGGFWYDIAVYCILFAVAMTLILGSLGAVYLVRLRRKKRSDNHPQGNPQR